MAGDDVVTPAAMLRARRIHAASGAKRRTATREQICNAASTLFVRRGFAAVTMEEIALGAGIRRSTLYTHFADKEQIMAAIAAEYIGPVCTMIRRLPAPLPSHEEIAAWLDAFASFVADRPGPAELMTLTGHQVDVPRASTEFGGAMLRCFGERFAAFQAALQPGEEFQLAWAHATIAEFALAVTYRARHGDQPMARAHLAVAAMLLEKFIREER